MTCNARRHQRVAGHRSTPYAEIDYKTSGGHDSYNAMQLSVTRRSAKGVTMNAQYTLGLQQGQHGRIERGGDRRQQRARASSTSTTTTATTTSTCATRSISAPSTTFPAQGVLRRLERRRHRQRAKRTADQRADRPQRHRLRRCAGERLHQPGGGSYGGHQHAGRRSFAQRPQAGPRAGRGSVHQERRAGVPEPGGVRDAAARDVRQPRAQLDPRADSYDRWTLSSRSTFRLGGRSECRSCAWRSSICSTPTNFANPGGTLPKAIPNAALSEANRVQPGQPYTAAAAGEPSGASGARWAERLDSAHRGRCSSRFRFEF